MLIDEIPETLIATLRVMAREGAPPSSLLRMILLSVAPEAIVPPLLVRYFSKAFCFTEGQAYPIFGWRPDGTGELNDEKIDCLLSKRMQQTKAEWNKPDDLSGCPTFQSGLG